MRLKDLDETFRDDLRDPEFAAGYLEAALEENNFPAFLIALRDVVKAQGGMAKAASETELGRSPSIKHCPKVEIRSFRRCRRS